jgi:hypothetical protein
LGTTRKMGFAALIKFPLSSSIYFMENENLVSPEIAFSTSQPPRFVDKPKSSVHSSPVYDKVIEKSMNFSNSINYSDFKSFKTLIVNSHYPGMYSLKSIECLRDIFTSKNDDMLKSKSVKLYIEEKWNKVFLYNFIFFNLAFIQLVVSICLYSLLSENVFLKNILVFISLGISGFILMFKTLTFLTIGRQVLNGFKLALALTVMTTYSLVAFNSIWFYFDKEAILGL